MKKNISILLTAVMMALAFTVNAFAATENTITKVVTVKEDTELKEDAPILTIASSKDHNKDFNFEVTLNGAEWIFDKAEGNFGQEGVTYKQITINSILVNVNVEDDNNDENKVFDAKYKDIEIPLVTKIVQNGNIEVIVDGIDSTVSSGKYVFAKCPYDGNVTIECNRIETIVDEGTLGEIIFSDSTAEPLKAGTEIKFKLTNGLKFIKEITPKTTGKFEDTVEFKINSKDASIAIIKVTKDIPAKTGKIVLSDLLVSGGDSQDYGNVELTTTYKGKTIPITVAKFGKMISYDKDIVINKIKVNEEKPVVSGFGAEGRTIILKIDDKEVGTSKVGVDGKWSVTYPDNMDGLKEGKHSITVAYYRASTGKLTKPVTQEFSIDLGKNNIVVRIGYNSLILYGKNVSIDSPAFIDGNSRTMLPLRAIANALDIKDKDIIWDDVSDKVTLKRNDGKEVKIKIGSDVIFIDGKRYNMNTKAILKGNRTFLPMRELFNAFGVSDDNIKWDDSTKTVTVNR